MLHSERLPSTSFGRKGRCLAMRCLAAAALLGGTTGCQALRDLSPIDFAGGRVMFHLLPSGFIKAIDRPVFAAAEEAELGDDERVLGVVGRKGSARAYPVKRIKTRDIVNDVLDGEPIAVTW